MEQHLEHSIKKAFQNKDANTGYPNKNEMWNRIENATGKKNSVPAFWRIAAVLLGFFMISGVFAGFILNKKNQNQKELLENTIHNLNDIVDSLNNISPKIITETKLVEKEVRVYVPAAKTEDKSVFRDYEIENLSQENILLKKQLENEREVWKAKADSFRTELLALKQNMENLRIDSEDEKQRTQLFELKSEKYEMPYQQKPKTENPKVKLQIFSNPSNNKHFDMNSSILKK